MFKVGKNGKRGSDETDEVPTMQISSPTNVTHDHHVGFDKESGRFVGLPAPWEAWLGTSNIR